MFFVLITDVWALKVTGSNDLYCSASSLSETLGKQVIKDVPGIKNSTCFCLGALATWVQAAQLSGNGPASSACALLGGGPYAAQAPGRPWTLWPSRGAQRRHPLAEARPWPTDFGFLKETATLPQLPASTLLATLLLASPASRQPAQPRSLCLTSWVLGDAAPVPRGLMKEHAPTALWARQ